MSDSIQSNTNQSTVEPDAAAQRIRRQPRRIAKAAAAAASGAASAVQKVGTIDVPPPSVPRGLSRWMLFGGFVVVFFATTGTTDALLQAIWPGTSYWYSFLVQCVFLSVERAHFSGKQSGFTWFVLGIDTLINAAGLGVSGFASGLLNSPQVAFVAGNAGVGLGDLSTGLGLLTMCGLLGYGLAWSGDRLFHMSLTGR
jgi:hypothetical protein